MMSINPRASCELFVRFSDCDPLGHLYNVRYLDYLFDGRDQHVAENYPLLRDEMRSRQRNWVIVSTDIRYLASVRHGDRVRIESSLVEVERHGVKLEIAMSDAVTARLKSVLWSQLRFVDLERNIIVNHSAPIQTFFDAVRLPTDATTLDQRVRDLKQVETPD
jgi:acyl-CoA thioester hydrolase